MTTDRQSAHPRRYLILAAVGLATVSLSYGIAPATVLPTFLSVSIEGTDLVHIFRAVMCLYLGMASFWLLAVFNPQWQRAAVVSVVLFMAGLAAGRLLSLVIDGMPGTLLVIYLGLEVLMVLLGLLVLYGSAMPSDQQDSNP